MLQWFLKVTPNIVSCAVVQAIPLHELLDDLTIDADGVPSDWAQIDKMASAVDAEQTIEPTEVDELLFCVRSFVTRSKNMSACCELRRSLLALCSVCLAGGAEEGADAADAADEVAGNPQGSQPRKRSVNHVAKRRLSRIFQDDLLHLATMESICVGEDSSEDDTITE